MWRADVRCPLTRARVRAGGTGGPGARAGSAAAAVGAHYRLTARGLLAAQVLTSNGTLWTGSTGVSVAFSPPDKWTMLVGQVCQCSEDRAAHERAQALIACTGAWRRAAQVLRGWPTRGVVVRALPRRSAAIFRVASLGLA